jgi:hypothetical protein
MKMFISFFSLALSLSSFASSIDSKTFVYDGSQSSIDFVLKTEKNHTEYRVEDVLTTCYRSQVVGRRSLCTGGLMGGFGYSQRGPFPGPFPTQCYSEPIYRQVPYSCTQTIRTPFQVKDFDVEARVSLEVSKVSAEVTPGETFKVSLEQGDKLVFTAVGSKKFFIIKKKQDVTETLTGSVKYIDAKLAADLVEAAPLQGALKITDIALDNAVLNFKVGEGANLARLGFSLKVAKVKFLGSDTTLLDKDLTSSEVNLDDAGIISVASVNVSKLGLDLVDGKFSLTAKVFPKFDGKLMNSDQFETLSAFRTLIFKSR